MRLHPVVFFVSAGVSVLFVVLGAAFSDPVENLFTGIQAFIATVFGWFYILAVTFFLGFSIWLLFSRYADFKLGKDHEEPDYSYFTWFAMLFSAGMGIGLMFFSVAEPLLHYAEPPDAEPETIAAAKEAMTTTFFHWGLHAWGIYIVVALALAYFSFRHDLPLTMRSTLYPLLGDRIHGGIGNLVEILAVFGTLFGIATSLGFGATQINAGLDYLGLLESSLANQLLLIAVIALAALISVVTGLDRGIRRLSEVNLLLGLALTIFVFVAGPTVFLMKSLVQSLGNYGKEIIALSFDTDAYGSLEWQRSWTLFYWAWWISWSPFVGMFVARVSRGRTIREFIGGVLLVPTLLTFIWLVVFGNTALHMEVFGAGGLVQQVQESTPTALFAMLDRLPWAALTSLIAIIVIATYFVTSSDSASLVASILTSGGDPDPPIAQRVFWASAKGAVAAILLIAGGLTALQTAAITTAAPFCIVLLAICYSTARGLRREYVQSMHQQRRQRGLGRGTAGRRESRS